MTKDEAFKFAEKEVRMQKDMRMEFDGSNVWDTCLEQGASREIAADAYNYFWELAEKNAC